ncbi:MAG: NAD(P)(+) transhydrogenase (Re/Si-specific) subunit alpha, partial [Rhodocyclaceae bacterium]|nr:NAD(P)(+) transhydrogenase (Re/Si-specific) subunit alpha [Rhodocyclaceae bacterium]
MPLTIAVSRERAPGESRVALVPETAKKFIALGAKLQMEQSAGIDSHLLDPDYVDVTMVNGISEAYGSAQLILRVTPPSPEEIAAMPEGAILIGLLKPY